MGIIKIHDKFIPIRKNLFFLV